LLSRHYVVPHISTGDVLRAAVRDGTPLGRKAEEYMNAGELLPDDIMNLIVGERLASPDAKRGWILDGYPRTIGQAESLDPITDDRPLHAVVDIDVPEDVVVARISKRRVCIDCGTTYSVDAHPRYDWTCDVCGGDVRQRDDDTEEAVRQRLALYREQTSPLLDWYSQQGLLDTIDGVADTDEVFQRIVSAVDARLGDGVAAV
jgi:adenylate kinase